MPDGASAILGRTVPDLLARRAKATPDAVAFRIKETGDTTSRAITWAEHHAAVERMARALAKWTLHPGDRVGILAPTSIRWEIAQMGVLARGAVVVGVDPNYPDDQLADILRGVCLTGLFVHDHATLLRLESSVVGGLEFVCVLYGRHEGNGHDANSFDALMDRELGDVSDAEPKGRPQPGDGALIVFSSGTTGKPKPIEYSHAQAITAVAAILEVFPDLEESTRLLCWLPLANLFQRMINFCAIARGASSDLISDPREVMTYIGEASPHLMIGVPRFFERIHGAIQHRMSMAPKPIAWLGRWALTMGARSAQAKRTRTSMRGFDRVLAPIADRLVLSRLRRVFGRNLRYLVSGSAPMPLRLLEFFDAIGLPVYEAYGVSENIVPVAMNRPGMHQPGTVGRPLPVNEVALSLDGEIRVRGPGVFGGYWNAADEQARPDADGFWGTGDLGVLDGNGFLRITGRKSDLFKTSTGRWVSPVEIEQQLQLISYVDYALVFGAGRKTVVALLGIDPTRFAAAVGPDVVAVNTGIGHTALRADIAATTQALPAYCRPAALLISTKTLSIDRGELTTNLKFRRKAIEAKYSVRIEELYATLERDRPATDKNSGWLPVLEA